MEPIVDFKILPERLRQAAQVVTVAVASPADSHTEEVIERSIAEQFARFILVANAAKADIARRLAADYPDKVTLIVAEDDDDAARHAVKEVREDRADVLMKGSLNTDNLLRAVLNKEEGILIKGSVLTHIAVADVPSLNHLLFFTDAAVIPYPTTEQFDALARYITATYRSITGGDRPRVALIHCTEKVSEKFPLTLSYEELKANAAKGALRRGGHEWSDGRKDSLRRRERSHQGHRIAGCGQSQLPHLPRHRGRQHVLQDAHALRRSYGCGHARGHQRAGCGDIARRHCRL